MKNENAHSINYNFIAKYLANETNEADNEVFDLWLQNENNRKTFVDIKSYWEIFNKSKKMNKVNVDKAWNNVRSRIEEDKQNNETVLCNKFSQTRRFMQRAAIIIFFIALSISGYLFYNSSYNPILYTTIKSSSSINNKKVILPDGSKAYLYAKSKINFPKEFTSNTRDVNLIGEAFFEISKNPDKPFIVSAQNAKIKVIGTSFNVNANLPNKKVEVFVKKGCVKLYDKNNKLNNIILNKGYIGLQNKNEITKKLSTNENYISWKTKKIIFKDTKLIEVINVLNKTYNVEI
nr:FecR family protein [Bacteroidales bacterium]